MLSAFTSVPIGQKGPVTLGRGSVVTGGRVTIGGRTVIPDERVISGGSTTPLDSNVVLVTGGGGGADISLESEVMEEDEMGTGLSVEVFGPVVDVSVIIALD